MRPFLLTLAACAPLLLPASLGAASITLTKTVDLEIPDNDSSGLVSVIPFVGTGPVGSQWIQSVEVSLATHGGWNGDLYAYLEHNGVISVLLNRPGRSAGDTAGSPSAGLSIWLADSALQDVHTGLPTSLGAMASGVFQPDARAADPDAVTDASPRSLYLSGFSTMDPTGNWTLFIADLSGGDTAVLDNWSLTVNVVPEPSVEMLGIAAATGWCFVRRRHQA